MGQGKKTRERWRNGEISLQGTEKNSRERKDEGEKKRDLSWDSGKF